MHDEKFVHRPYKRQFCLSSQKDSFPLIQSSRKQYVALAAGWLGGGGGGQLADI